MKRNKIIWMVSAGAVLVLMIYVVFPRDDETSPTSDASDESLKAPEVDRPATMPPRPAIDLTRIPASSTQPAPAAPASGDEGEPAKPECLRDEDCRGPHTAECIDTKCQSGKCVYDKGPCECRTPADCDDGDPCTRNHCFVPTMSCIYIPEGCDTSPK